MSNKTLYQHRRHNKNLLMVHMIFATKYRKKLLYGSFDKDIKQYIYDACTKHHWYVKKMESDKDHIHMLIQYNPTDSVSMVASVLKQCSTYNAWKYHEKWLINHYWKERTHWSDGFFACSIGQVSQATIEHYIENQG